MILLGHRNLTLKFSLLTPIYCYSSIYGHSLDVPSRDPFLLPPTPAKLHASRYPPSSPRKEPSVFFLAFNV